MTIDEQPGNRDSRARMVSALLAQAAATNAKRDMIDRQMGFKAPSDLFRADLIRTAIDALYCGLLTEDWSCVAEAADMLGGLVRYKRWHD